ncbi:cation transporter [Pseudenhygromyxa sp. WMMC2535]|uniref:cation diffusion facilitator family transporter n=1 Tax=Pseudenhygromyxa sp. WMMC2535 TaxID=2712867 RepID=UPI0015523EB4|nr:cation diffusion facilitator family transporter [Pseudenhygromyxa sp. WMMC2535]NVB41394.1 cation transporter [Pseudenhygromyxa sp. WMMC2535]
MATTPAPRNICVTAAGQTTILAHRVMTKEQQQAIARTHALGVAGNVGLAALKLVVGTLAGSPALLADGIHSLSDVLMTTGAWTGWRWSARPRDADHHYGHGNGEALTALIIGLVVLVAGVGLIWASLRGESQVGRDLLSVLAVAVELVGMMIKLGLARITARRGRELDSPILVAVARDHRADVLSSGLLMLAIIGAIFGLRWLEPAAAVVVGLLILRDGLRSVRDGLDVLMDRAPDSALTARIAALARAVEGVEALDDLRVHPLGTHLRVDMEIAVRGELRVDVGHQIAHAVEDSVRSACPEVHEVAVHVNPARPRADEQPEAQP